MNQGILLVGALLAIAVVLLLAKRRRRGMDGELRERFGLPADFKVIGTDLGGGKNHFYLRADGLIGEPDAAFHSRKRQHWVMGEFKSRKYRGHIKPYERYQVTMYVGMARSKYHTKSVTGALLFDDKLVPVPFSESLYRQLCAMGPEFLKAEAAWRAPNPLPLVKR